MKKIALILTTTFIISCGNSQDENKTKITNTKTQTEYLDSKNNVEKFTIKAIGNTMSDMKYDVPNITVKEGSKVEITLINEGIDMAMMHNIIFVKYGTRKEVATEAINAGIEAKYIPQNNNIIAASDLAKPGETVILEFQAPAKGNYEFICTTPGHSEIMRGYFFVK